MKHKELLTKLIRIWYKKLKMKVNFTLTLIIRYHNFVCKDFQNKHPVPTSPDTDEIYAAATTEARRLNDYIIDIESLAPAPGRLKLSPIRPGKNGNTYLLS